MDACLGGFLLPFAETVGFSQGIRDFRLPGVTSISCDVHKYGYSPKGVSVLMWRNEDLRRLQYYSYAEWTGGLYATVTLAGSRAGSVTAAAWATLMCVGRQGYENAAFDILTAADKLKKTEIPGLELMGDPTMSVVSYTSKEFSSHAVGEVLGKKGWVVNNLLYPNGFHICITNANHHQVDELVVDLKDAIEIVKNDPELVNKGVTALYGAAVVLPDKGVVSDICKHYLDSWTYLG